jgi:hypothetical protein
MAADKSGDEDLVFHGQPRQLRQGESAFDNDVPNRQPHPFHNQRLPLGQGGQFLPILGFHHGRTIALRTLSTPENQFFKQEKLILSISCARN